MNMIYVVVSSGGEYEDAWRHNEVACLSLAAAEQYIADAKIKHQKQILDCEEYNIAACRRIDELGPSPYWTLLPIPKWKAGISEKDITPEMRAERDDIKAKNDEIKAKARTVMEKRYFADEKFRKNFFLARGYDEDDTIMHFDIESEVEFSYEELKVIK